MPSQPEQSTAENTPVLGLQRFLAELARLATDRAGAELQIEAQYRARNSAADRTFQESRQALDDWLTGERRGTAEDYTDQQRHALARFETENATLQRQYAEVKQQAADEFEAAGERAVQRLNELRWEAETLFEAGKDVAPRQLQQLEQSVDAWLAQARADVEHANWLLQQWRHPAAARPAESPPSVLEAGNYATRLQERVNAVAAYRTRLGMLRLPPLVSGLTLAWVFALVALLAAGLALALGFGAVAVAVAGGLPVVAGIGTYLFLRRLATTQIDEIYVPLCQAADEAETLAQCVRDEARARAAQQQEKILRRRQRALQHAEEKYRRRVARANQKRATQLQAAEANFPLRLEEVAVRRDRDLELGEQIRARREAEIRQKEADRLEIVERYRRQTEQIEQQHAAQWQSLGEQWQASLAHMRTAAADLHGTSGGRWLTDWTQLAGGSWSPGERLPEAIRFGQIRIPLDQIDQGTPQHGHWPDLTQPEFTLPALVPFPDQPSLVIKSRGPARAAAIEMLQTVMLRLLVTIPPGKLRFTIVDPVGLGEHFAAFMHLADYNEALITSRIWTDPRHIEERLADLSEHMEKVIQKYLRNEFLSIEQYNRDAGEIAEPYRFLVIADFPANFSDAAQRRLLSIVANGARCGVYTLIVVDTQQPAPSDGLLDELTRHATTLVWKDGRFVWNEEPWGQFELTLDSPPPPSLVTEILQTAGQYALQAGRVEVPFDVIAPPPDALWTSSARAGIDVPLGRVGATRLQSLKLGSGTSQHVLVSGKTGSGKSTLLHALVTNLALRYSPDEIELYLVDFKQGVEFKTYATHRLPHARVVAIESDREFGLSVLGRLDAELKLRADQFRVHGVQDLAGYRQANGSALMPRILLIVDEFQEFFVEDDKISQDAALLLDRLVRQGRAFGIHVLLGSQTLAGTYTLSRSTIGQMAVRIALQCSEADAHLILSEENSAARLLSRAGEAIYNDTNGLVEGNHPFQVVWLADDRREEYLEQIRALAIARGGSARSQVVFEGNIPADPAQNAPLGELLRSGRPATSGAAMQAWLGEAVAIKDPTSATFRRQSGSNLLVVGQNEDAALGILATTLVSLLAQHSTAEATGSRYYIFDGSPAGSPQSASLALLHDLDPDAVRLVAWRDVPTAVTELAREVERRQAADDGDFPPVYVFVHGLQKLRDLRRQEDDFGFSRRGEDLPPQTAQQFSGVLRDGPAVGVHAIVWCDSVNNLHRAWDRQTFREFEMRVAFQMSGNDSSTLIDTPAGGKLGTNRALYHCEEQGILEKFRPYRWPAENWLAWVREQLHCPAAERDGRPHERPLVAEPPVA